MGATAGEVAGCSLGRFGAADSNVTPAGLNATREVSRAARAEGSAADSRNMGRATGASLAWTPGVGTSARAASPVIVIAPAASLSACARALASPGIPVAATVTAGACAAPVRLGAADSSRTLGCLNFTRCGARAGGALGASTVSPAGRAAGCASATAAANARSARAIRAAERSEPAADRSTFADALDSSPARAGRTATGSAARLVGRGCADSSSGAAANRRRGVARSAGAGLGGSGSRPGAGAGRADAATGFRSAGDAASAADAARSGGGVNSRSISGLANSLASVFGRT